MSKSIPFRTAYGPKLRVYAEIGDKSLTKESMANECDINVIMKRFEQTGLISHVREGSQPRYGDFTDYSDYQDSLNRVLNAQDAFMALDARIRERFANDPANLLAFLDDKSNFDEAVKLGLVDQKIDNIESSKKIPAEPVVNQTASAV